MKFKDAVDKDNYLVPNIWSGNIKSNVFADSLLPFRVNWCTPTRGNPVTTTCSTREWT